MQRALAQIAIFLMLSCGKQEAKETAAAASASSPVAATGSPSASAATTASAAASASATPSASAAEVVPPPKCPAGLVGNGFPAYCIKVPSNYGVKQARTSPKRGSVEYDTGSATDNLMISYDETPIAQASKDVESEMKFGGDKLAKKGDLPGGNKWFQGTHADYSRVVTLYKGQGSLTLKCSFAYQAKKAPAKEAIDACKSIVIP